jgi:hypothetical protein
VLNHEELVTKLAKACSRIAESLPRADLSLILYPTPAMKEAVARLYANIMKFVVRALRWYRQGRPMHMLSSITNPWRLDFEQELGEVEQDARGIDNLAQSASQAELREAHLQIQHTRSDLQVTRNEIRQLTRFVEEGFQRMTSFALGEHFIAFMISFYLPSNLLLSENQSLQSRMANDISSSKDMIHHVQIGQILSLSFMECLPTSGQCLAHCRSLWLRRRGSMQRRLIPDARLLRSWNEQKGLTFVVTENINTINAKDFLVDVIGVLHRQDLPVLWALRSPDLKDSSLTSRDVIRMLLYQALQINSSALNNPHPITIAHLREASTHEDWLVLLKRALRGLPTIYIIFDSDLLDYVMGRDRLTTTRLLMEFGKVLGPERVKIIVSSQSFETGHATRDLGASAVAILRGESPRRNIRALRRQRAHQAGRRSR